MVKIDLEIAERVAEVIKYWRKGHFSVTDSELQMCINFLIAHLKFLKEMGETYRLVWWDLQQVYIRFEKYQEERRRVR